MALYQYDFCIVGAGSAGYAAATRAQELGKSVGLVDGMGPLGGLCILRGCMPGKTVLHSAEVARTVRHASSVGVDVYGFNVNSHKIIDRKRRLVEDFAASRVRELQESPLLRGPVRFRGSHELQVGEDRVRASKFLIATGSVINIPPLPGLRETGYLDSDDILDLKQLPKNIIILGGGAVCVELALYLKQSGVEVTILQRSPTLLSSEDPDIGECLRAVFEREGITVVTGVQFQHIERTAHGKRVHVQVNDDSRGFEAQELFTALGRRANVDGFGFERAGVDYNENGVCINEYLQTTNPDIYAAGDVTGIWRLLHVAVYEGKLAAQNAFTNPAEPARYDLYRARAIFSSPQVGIAGFSERRAQARGVWYDKASHPFSDLGRAIVINATDGFAKMLAAKDGTILGITIVGAQASDMIHEAIALLYFQSNVRDVLAMPHIHPTLAEILTYPATELAGRIHSRPTVELGYAAG